MTTTTRTQSDLVLLCRQTGAITPGTRSSLQTGAIGAALLAAAAIIFSVPERSWGMTLLGLAVGGLGLLLAAVAVIELIPTPGRLAFYEHGFADVHPDHTIDLYPDAGSLVTDRTRSS